MTTTTQTTATWLDSLPAIPLAKSVPVTLNGLSFVACDVFADGPGFYICGAEEADDPHNWRVDLDDPQGFGYALRWLYKAYAGRGSMTPRLRGSLHGLRARWIADLTTDADRLALAQAIAEVQA